MGLNKTKVTGFRFEDKDVLLKLNAIADAHCRTRNKEVEYALKLYVSEYEKEHGTIDISPYKNEE